MPAMSPAPSGGGGRGGWGYGWADADQTGSVEQWRRSCSASADCSTMGLQGLRHFGYSQGQHRCVRWVGWLGGWEVGCAGTRDAPKSLSSQSALLEMKLWFAQELSVECLDGSVLGCPSILAGRGTMASYCHTFASKGLRPTARTAPVARDDGLQPVQPPRPPPKTPRAWFGSGHSSLSRMRRILSTMLKMQGWSAI